MKSRRNHPKKSSKLKGFGGRRGQLLVAAVYPANASNDLFQRDWPWLLPSPARHGGCKKRPQPPRRLPSPWTGRGILERKRERIEKGGEVNKGGYGFASAGEPLLPSGFFSP